MNDPRKSITDYLINHGFLSKRKMKYSQVKISLHNNNKREVENIKRLKILDIRKYEHFGDVFMFLNKNCPLWVKVKSRKADLLLLKKLDAIDISSNYQDIWKRILKRPLANSKNINKLILKILSNFCNYYGIKAKYFKKKKNHKNYPIYYIKPKLYKKFIKKSKKKSKLNKDEVDKRKKNLENKTNFNKKLKMDENKNEVNKIDKEDIKVNGKNII